MKRQKNITHKHARNDFFGVNKYAAIICLVASAILIFRAHYYHSLIIIVALLCSSVPVVVFFDPHLEFIIKKIAEGPRWRKFIDKILSIPIVLGWFFCIYQLHEGYQSFAFSKNTEYVEALIEEEDVRTHKGGSTKYFIYSYSQGNTKYCNEMKADGSGYALGDVFYLKISTFDPTVTELTK